MDSQMKYLVAGIVSFVVGCVSGCTVEPVPTPPPTDYCDFHAVDWNAPTCESTTSSGVFAPDQRFVCPQADGTEWGIRATTLANGYKLITYERYEAQGPSGTPAAHIPAKQLCLVANDGRVIVRVPR